MKQYVIYRRVSTKQQGKSGLGLEAQDRDIQTYLHTYSDRPFEVLAEFTEVQTGSDSDRPMLTEALQLCRKTGAELLVAKLDRLSRKLSFIAALIEDQKVNFRVASMPRANNFQLHIYAALAEQEREFISLRTKAALARAKARKVKLGGLRPKTEARNKAIQANAKARAEKVAKIILPLREKGLSLPQIAEALNAAGTPTARGGVWHPSQVMRVLNRLSAE